MQGSDASITAGLSGFEKILQEDAERLRQSAGLALILCFVAFLVIAVSRNHTATLPKSEAPFLEAEILQQPEPAHLVEKKATAIPAPAEKKLSTSSKPSASSKTMSTQDLIPKENQTQAVPPVEAVKDRGPVVISAPTPKLPEYLRNQNLKTNVLIEFLISKEGKVEPRLIGSSGNEELDALALKTARTWSFQPALQQGNAIDSKVRLRINFEVQ